MVLRHILSNLFLPFLVVVGVPYRLLTAFAAFDTRWSSASPLAWLPRLAGALAYLGGLFLFSWCVWLFARIGRGTLAPWDATRSLVAVGPYRYVRNPMIGGVALMLFGEVLLWGSRLLGLWAVFFVGLNHLYFLYSEEPGLEKRFGEDYRRYKAAVPRWLPRLGSRGSR